MPVPSTIADLSTVADDNSPRGSEPIGTSLDNYIRAAFAFIKQLSTGSGASGTWGISITGNAATATSSLATPTIGDRSLKLATTAMFSNEFASSIASSGYQKLPSGLIIQWGVLSATTTTASTATANNLPIAFPTAAFSATASRVTDVSTAASPFTTEAVNVSTTQITISHARSSGSIPNVWRWIAIGY